MAAFVDALVGRSIDLLVSTLAEEVRHVNGVGKEVKKLTSSLRSIKAVLVDAERRQWKEEAIQVWLDNLRSVAYDIGDVLDEWSYEILRSKIESEVNADKPRSKVWSSKLLSACYCFPKVVSRHHMADKISELNATLDEIAADKDKYSLQPLESNIVEHNRTTPVIDISEVRGREAEKEKLVDLLLSGNGEQKEVRVISVVGMGGIGKTTLAKLVYNDERVKSHFHKRIWVCVSDPFDETRIAKEILESLEGAKPNLNSLPNIVMRIQELVVGEECLFVLDDVWNEDRGKWEQLKDCLKGSASKSSILVTTRKEEVGRIMGCLKSNMVRVGELSGEDSWELFRKIAFFGRSSGEWAILKEIGREVIKRCKGLPLAIKAIAGVLQLKESKREWQNVLGSELWNGEEFQRDIAPALWLSYYDLPSNLKQCFSYCAVFPKDYRMDKDVLIRHWIAQGYVKGTKSKDLVTVGEEYFQNLVMRSLFQDVEDNVFNTKISCKMHDIVHDFAQLLVKKECHSIEVNDVNAEINLSDDSFTQSLRHLSISFKNRVKCLDSLYDLKKLHSLIVSTSVFSSIFFGLDLQKLFNKFTVLRSLILRSCGIVEVPSNINRLIHLTELDLSWNLMLEELPDTFWELYSLQILNLDCTGIQFVRGIERLTNLMYLGNAGCCLPKGVVRLSGLRRLGEVTIDVSNEEALSLKHLKNFNQLGGHLRIEWLKQDDRDVEDAKQAQLMNKKHITGLVLNFGLKEEEERSKQEEEDERRSKREELVEALHVPPNLELLHMRNYMGRRSPNWLHSLTAVTEVVLYNWSSEHLPPLGKLSCLEHLRLSIFERVVKVGVEFLGMDEKTKLFRNLKSLHFDNFPNWEEWDDVDADGDEEMLIMPSLTYLSIQACPKLKALPNFILKKTSLKLDTPDIMWREFWEEDVSSPPRRKGKELASRADLCQDSDDEHTELDADALQHAISTRKTTITLRENSTKAWEKGDSRVNEDTQSIPQQPIVETPQDPNSLDASGRRR